MSSRGGGRYITRQNNLNKVSGHLFTDLFLQLISVEYVITLSGLKDLKTSN